VFSSRDVEKYLQDIMDLEKTVKLRDIQVARLESQLSLVMREVDTHRKQGIKVDSMIQEIRAENVDLKTRLMELEGKHTAVVQEQTDSLEKLKKELGKAIARDDYDVVKDARDKLDKQVKEMQKAIESRDTQIRRLTEDNLKLKDKLKFLKQENIP